MPECCVVALEDQSPYLAEVIAALYADGVELDIIRLRAEQFPLFDARPLADYNQPELIDLLKRIVAAPFLCLMTESTVGGVPGSLTNLLQLLGGAAYDEPNAVPPLRGLAVGLIVGGSEFAAGMALDQLQLMVVALGGTPVAATPTSGPISLAPHDFVQTLLHGPFSVSGASDSSTPLDLGLGHLQFSPPPAAQEAVIAAAGHISLYTPPAGLAQLRQALAAQWRAQGLAIPLSAVTLTSGASLGLYVSLVAHLQPGDGVLIPDPGFPNFRRLTDALHLRAVPYTLRPEHSFLPDLQELAGLAPSARAIIWNFPHNPLGTVAPQAMVQAVVQLAEQHDLLVISDEVYADLVWEGQHISPLLMGSLERVCVVGSFSKAYVMAGHRLGWVITSPPRAERLAHAHWTIAMSPALLSQQAGLASLRTAAHTLPKLRQQLLNARSAAHAILTEYAVPCDLPPAAFYFWIDIQATGLDTNEFVSQLFQEERLQVMPGLPFGAQGAGKIRVSFGAPHEQVIEGATRLGRFYQKRVHAWSKPR